MSYAESRQRKAIAKYGGATVATADMLTADKIQWSLGATIGRNRWSSESRAKRLAA